MTVAIATTTATDQTLHQTTPATIGSSTAALATRCASELLFLGEAAEAAFALSIILDCLAQELRAKIGPVSWRDPIFAIRRLPDQKVGKAPFAAGSNNQVGVGNAMCRKPFGDHLLVDRRSRNALGAKQTNRLDNIGAPAVVERNRERNPLVIAGQIQRRLCLTLKR